MNRKAKILLHANFAGILEETEEGYRFSYDSKYVLEYFDQSVSLTLPVREMPYLSKVLFPFFDGLIPEGWLLDIALDNWKINQRDRFGLLLACCKDCIGAVSVLNYEKL